MKQKITLHWFRRDLRLEDNTALFHALRDNSAVLPLFIFDEQILHDLQNKKDARVSFIYERLKSMHTGLQKSGRGLLIRIGTPTEVWRQLMIDYDIQSVYANDDYEPYANARDTSVRSLLQSNGIPLMLYKDHVVLEKSEVMKDDGTPYTVFTPFSKKWKTVLKEDDLQQYPSETLTGRFIQDASLKFPSLEEIGFERSEIAVPDARVDLELIRNYHLHRDFPAQSGTSRLSVHLRFGTISIRQLMKIALETNEKFYNELIWREFYQTILWHFPQVVHQSFKKEYNNIKWRNNKKEFDAWCEGATGYPIVDAGMRELLATGYMHNRVRMVVASFLTKHLLIDWRWGEAFFAAHLLDFELASNNGGWQWAAGCGVDAAPYFRIFNPSEQTRKFDPELKYIRKWVPEFDSLTYLQPIVDHAFARKRCLETYQAALK